MIYCIVATDPATHNEWVISTHDSVVSATKFCDNYRKQGTGYEYRIDTAEELEKIQDTHGSLLFTTSEPCPACNGTGEWTSMDGSALGKCVDCNGTGVETPAPDSLHSKPFTTPELFPQHNMLPESDCAECGAYVRLPKHSMHTAWHNKIGNL